MRKEIVTEVHIQAAPAAVWRVLLDFPAYPLWNPLITAIEGHADTGERLEITVALPDRRPMRFRPEVLRVLPEQELSWLGRLGVPGLFDGEHRFELEPTEDGDTLLRHREKFSGILLPLLWWRMGKPTRAGCEAMNRALRDRVESIGRAGSE
ncbi:SRPBCC domain-containing protein [Aquisalimonas sp. 2447]|uniref:SRPBCC domain-containing protein n=1 Tax=Aquisalimonas sp. 2447 TaxID=2740807 RepID=UPI00143261A5|nr:SRPBCC domain-containing protein [Aquisalimonas sp. 2447]QIT56628.1 SRPBCC domain-containing protein [Aquisalimonas sp. 2447]